MKLQKVFSSNQESIYPSKGFVKTAPNFRLKKNETESQRKKLKGMLFWLCQEPCMLYYA